MRPLENFYYYALAAFLRPRKSVVETTLRSLRSSTPIKVQHVMHDNSNISLEILALAICIITEDTEKYVEVISFPLADSASASPFCVKENKW